MNIEKLTIVTAQGVKEYAVGKKVGLGIVEKIKIDQIRFTGDPFDHYCGFDEKGKMLFSVNCLVPCEIEYT